MDHFEFHKSNYLIELQRKNDLSNSITLPVGIVSVLGGVIFVILKDMKDFSQDCLYLLLAIMLAISTISLIIAVIFLILSDYNFKYLYVPTSSESKKYYDDLLAYYHDDAEQAEPEFVKYIEGEYAANAHVNALNNDSKSAYLHKAKSFIIGALVFLLFACPFYFSKYYVQDQTHKVQITNLDTLETLMNSDNKDKSTPQQQRNAETPPPPPLKKPEPPKSRSLRESQQPTKTPPPSKDN